MRTYLKKILQEKSFLPVYKRTFFSKYDINNRTCFLLSGKKQFICFYYFNIYLFIVMHSKYECLYTVARTPLKKTNSYRLHAT